MSTTFTVSVSAATLVEAEARVSAKLVDGFVTTTCVGWKSERHGLAEVEVTGNGDRNDCWVMLTSYGMVPSRSLASSWQNVAGVGA